MAKSTNKRRAPKKKAALLVRFHSVSEYERLQKAAAREQAPVKNDIRNYPNVSKFLRDAGDAKADEILGDKSAVDLRLQIY